MRNRWGAHTERAYPLRTKTSRRSYARPSSWLRPAYARRGFLLLAVLALLLTIPIARPDARIAFADGPPDLTISQFRDGVFYVGSANALYNFSVSNNASAGSGTGPITITDTLPNGMTFKSIYGNSFNWDCTATGQQVTCTRTGTFPPDFSDTVGIAVDISAAAAGPQSNVVTVATPGETNTGNNSSSNPVTVAASPPPPNLNISIGSSGTFVVGSSTSFYSFTIANQYGGPTTGPITVTDTLPTGMTFGSIGGLIDDWVCSGTTTVTCTSPGPMVTGAFKFLSFSVNTTSAALGTRLNGGSVSTPGDSDLSDNTANPTTVTVIPSLGTPDLTSNTYLYSANQFFVGSTGAVYGISVFNSGDATTAPLTLTDVLPTGITFAEIYDDPDSWTCGGTTTVTCTRPAGIGAGGGTFVRIKVNLAPEAAGPRSNTVTVSMPGESNTTNNMSSPVNVTVAAAGQPLTATSAGSGAGTVAFTNFPYTVPCGASCSPSFVPNTRLVIAATPTPGSVFMGWSGACTGTSGTCQVTMNSAKNVTANFSRLNLGVQVQTGPVSGTGVKSLTATLTARPGCGSIDHIQFGKPGFSLDNARVAITSPAGGPSNQSSAFNYVPPPGTTTVTLSIQRVVQSGAATVSPIIFVDGCGAWPTFVGGGPRAFE